MSGLNLTGRPQPGDYLLGRGKVMAAPILPDGTPGAFRHLGNSPNFAVNVTTENIEHQTSLQSVRVTDADCILSLKAEVAFDLDELNFQNLADFFLGDAVQAGYVNPAIAGFAATAVTASAEQGRWYDILSPTGLKPKGFTSGTVTVVSDSGGAATALVEGTDYELDLVHGMIFLIAGGAAAVGLDITVAVAANVGAPANINQVRALTQGVTAVAVRFHSLDGCDAGKQQEYKFHSVTLKPDGELPLIGDEFATISFSGVAAASLTAYPTSPYFTIEDAQA